MLHLVQTEVWYTSVLVLRVLNIRAQQLAMTLMVKAQYVWSFVQLLNIKKQKPVLGERVSF